MKKQIIIFLVIAALSSALAAQITYQREKEALQTEFGSRMDAPQDGSVGDDVLPPKLFRDPSGIPLPPENLVITMIGNDIQLQWDPVTLDTNLFPIVPDGYTIYLTTNPFGSYTYQDTTTDTQYTHVGVLNYHAKLFYRVRAVKN